MSRDKHRKARQKAEREAWEREQTRLAERRRRRMLLLGASAAAIVLSVVIGLVVAFAGSELRRSCATLWPRRSNIVRASSLE